ncbi:hypothetical protein J6590_054072 [Homalodisca vitripennis]|nr:hypothetical protein J6590_054072 [Homalodisca vitripennis]
MAEDVPERIPSFRLTETDTDSQNIVSLSGTAIDWFPNSTDQYPVYRRGANRDAICRSGCSGSGVTAYRSKD